MSHKANFLYPHEEGSVEEAGYEFVNGHTEEYLEQWWKELINRVKEVNPPDFKNWGDFKCCYDTGLKRNYYILGYFGGGPVLIEQAFQIARVYAEETGVSIASVTIDEILRSRRYKGFKIIYSIEEQVPIPSATHMVDVYKWLTD